MSIVRNYFHNFKVYNKTNIAGISLALITAAFVFVWGMLLALVVLKTGVLPSFGWWATIPVTLFSATLAHFLVRPVVAARYANK
jgi:membrane protein implicated in regulation of membrane protease activity